MTLTRSGTPGTPEGDSKRSEERLRIAVVVLHPDGGGGPSSAVATLISCMVSQSEITVYTARGPLWPVPEVTYVVLPAVPVYRFLIQFTTFRLSWRLYRALRRTLKRHDIVYGESALYGRCDVAAAHFHSREYLRLMLRNRSQFRGHAAKFGYELLIHGIASVLEGISYRGLARHNRTVLPPSLHLARSLQSTYGPNLITRVVPNPVDIERFYPGWDWEAREDVARDAGWPVDSVIAAFVGGAWERKGLSGALEGLARTPQGVNLLVVGAGDVRHYRKVAAALGIAERVHFRGPQPRIERLYRASDFIVLPSWYEVQPMVLLEAMACGRAVVARGFPGADELIRNGENGYIVSDPYSLAEALWRLAEDSGLRVEMGRKGREIAEQFSPHRVANKLESVLRAVTAEASGR